MAPTYCSPVVALSPFDLGFKTAEERSAKRFTRGAGESNNVRGGNPVQISPNFTSVHLLGQGRGGQISQSLEASEQDSDMGFMSIGWVMKIENLGSGDFYDLSKFSYDLRTVGLPYCGGRMSQLDYGGVLSEVGSRPLLFLANGNELGVWSRGEAPCARGSSTICYNDS